MAENDEPDLMDSADTVVKTATFLPRREMSFVCENERVPEDGGYFSTFVIKLDKGSYFATILAKSNAEFRGDQQELTK